MKNFILNFKQTIRFIVSIIVSREFAFCYVIAGTIAQVAHTYFLTESISSLSGGWRTFQAVLLSIFISSSLLYFTAIADNEDTKESRKVHFAVSMFTFIEILINVYYYSRHLIIDQEEYQIFDFIFAILVSCLIPVTIKLYASHIRAKEWITDIEHDKRAFVSDVETEKIAELVDSIAEEEATEGDEDFIQSMSDNLVDDIEGSLEDEEKMQPVQETVYNQQSVEDIVNTMLDANKDEFDKKIQELDSKIVNEVEFRQKLNDMFEEKVKNMNDEIKVSFEKNSELFLTQFQNKASMILKRKQEEM